MVIEVVLAEVGEHRQTQHRAIQAVFTQANGRGLDRTSRQALVNKLAQTRLQQHRIGRGQTTTVRPLRGLRHIAHAQGAHDSATATHGLQRMGQPPGGGGFAIGAGDGQHIQGFAGVSVVGRRNRTAVAAQSRIGSHTLTASRCVFHWVGADQGVPGETFLLNQTGTRAPRHDLWHMAAAIAARTRPSQKAVTRTHLPAVAVQLCAATLVQPLRSLLGGVQSGHQNDSGSALAMTWGRTATSGWMPIMRRVCCTVWLNTGAATSPP